MFRQQLLFYQPEIITEVYTMFLLNVPLFTLTLWGLILNLDASRCPKGQRVVVSKNKFICEECKSGQFQHEETFSKHCQTCTKCDEDSGSFVSQFCTRTSNTICRCHKGFVASDSDFSTCKCEAGFGKKSGECTECEDGYFSKSINSPCQRWKQCKSGVNITGTKTSDIVCNDEKSQTRSDSNVLVKVVSSDTTHQPQKTVQTPRLLATTTTRQIQHREPSPLSPADPLGFLVTIATVALLVLTVMIIKFYIGFYLENDEQKHESTCGRPVEEIGGGGEVSLKLTAEEV